MGFSGGPVVNNLAANAGDTGDVSSGHPRPQSRALGLLDGQWCFETMRIPESNTQFIYVPPTSLIFYKDKIGFGRRHSLTWVILCTYCETGRKAGSSRSIFFQAIKTMPGDFLTLTQHLEV